MRYHIASQYLPADHLACAAIGASRTPCTFRFMAELSLLGEFRFVEGPIYFKSWHGKNLSFKRGRWSRDHEITALACWAAWMIEVIAPAGTSVQQRRRLFKITLERFAGRQDTLKWIRSLVHNESKAPPPLRMVWDQLKRSEKLTATRQPAGHRAVPVMPDMPCSQARLQDVTLPTKRAKQSSRFSAHWTLTVCTQICRRNAVKSD